MLARRHDAGPVRVGKQDVVVVRQEADRDGGIRRWAGRPRQVEELDPVLVAEDLETRPEAFEGWAERQA
jgi:hypothetical protein